MPYIPILETITNAGATVSIPVDKTAYGAAFVNLDANNGAVTLAANLTVNFTGTPIDGQEVRVSWSNGFTLNGQTFTINGVSVTDYQTSKKGLIIFIYGGGSWQSRYTVSFNLTEVIEGFTLRDASLTLAKFPAQTRGFLWVGNASARPALVDFKTNAYIGIGDGTDYKSVPVTGDITITNAGVTAIGASKVTRAMWTALNSGRFVLGNGSNAATDVTMSGDVTMSNAGVTTIGAGKVTPSMLSGAVSPVKVATLSINSAAILALNSTPLQILAAQGTGTTIIPLNAIAQVTFGSSAYTTHVELDLYIDTAPAILAKITTALDAASSMTLQFQNQIGASGSGTQFVQNKGLFVTVPGGDPLAGDGTVFITLFYMVQ